MIIRSFILTVGVVGVLLAVLGALMPMPILMVVGASAFVVALVAGALAAPSVRRRR